MTIRIETLGTTDFDDVVDAADEAVAPTHPGEILGHQFMASLGLSASALARELGVPANRITTIINGERRVSADTALRFARFFGTTPELWLNLQDKYDLAIARQTHGSEIECTVRPMG